ncbi:hypothetical protein CRYUN_Cryun27aG0081700 [Craigia yunnanensis]
MSAYEDRTCEVWILSRERLLRNIVFPSIIDAIALDPGEHVFYAGSRDGKIFIAALNAESSPSNSYELHIIGSLSDHSFTILFLDGKPVTCLAYSAEGNLLLSRSEDGKPKTSFACLDMPKQQGSSAAEMEVERLKLDCKRSMQMVQQLKNVYYNLQEFCVHELLYGEQMGGSEGNSL